MVCPVADDDATDRLLGFLASTRKVRQVEVAATTGLAWLFGRYPSVRDAFSNLLNDGSATDRVVVSPDVRWTAEYRTPSGGRADLAAVGADGRVQACVEAKFGAVLTAAQVLDYIHADAGGRLLPVLVLHPGTRKTEVARCLGQVRQDEPEAVVVSLAWDRLFEGLLSELGPGPARGDVEQLESLAGAAQSLAVPPFADGVSGSELAARVNDLRRLGELASLFGNESGELWPYRVLSPGLDTGRYFALGQGLPNPAVGVRTGWVDHHPDQPLWLRLHSGTRGFRRTVAVWETHREQLGGDIEYGHLFVPLSLPRGVDGETALEMLATQVSDICEQLTGARPRPPAVGTTDDSPDENETGEDEAVAGR